MAIGKKTEMLATGGTDALVNLWFDCTAEEKEEAFRQEVTYKNYLHFFRREVTSKRAFDIFTIQL